MKTNALPRTAIIIAIALAVLTGLATFAYFTYKNITEDNQSTSTNTQSEGIPERQRNNTSDQNTIIADHTAISNFDSISDSSIQTAKSDFHIFYGHTSHGSQIITGLIMLGSQNSSLRKLPEITEYDGDLGGDGDLGWVDATKEALQNDSSINVVMWSWCGGVSENSTRGISSYLNAMDELEIKYPDVTFIYMTGHTDGSGEDGNLNRRNDQIRKYCQENGKFLYDFADIESWNPDGKYYPDTSDACEWCEDWCDRHECPDCSEFQECAHTNCFNCYIKGKAFWWLLAEIAERN
jgi:hypothetical protein